MPVLDRPDAEIYFEEFGRGYPVLLFAPGGLRSRMEMWQAPAAGPPRAWNDWTVTLAPHFRVIAMDQRNAGRSRGAIAADHGWHTYAADQLALMDHLGHQRLHTLGGSIGASFCLKLSELAPERISAAVLQNPIGFNPEAPSYFPDSHRAWSQEQQAARADLDAVALESFGRNLWEGDFVFSVTRGAARRCNSPCLLLAGNDAPHPAITGAELANLLPNRQVLDPWKGPEHLAQQNQRVLHFLLGHTPALGG